MWSPSLLGISNYIGGNGGTAKGSMADLRAKPLKIANAFSKESVTDWSETEKFGWHFIPFNLQMGTSGWDPESPQN